MNIHIKLYGSGYTLKGICVEVIRQSVVILAPDSMDEIHRSAIVRMYKRLQIIFLFLFLECNRSHVRTIASHIFIFISGVQLFACMNDFKPYFYFWECPGSHV